MIESISESTVLVAIGAASNLSGTINSVREIIAIAHGFDAEVVVDAVHFAPHSLIDVEDIGCDSYSAPPTSSLAPIRGFFGVRGAGWRSFLSQSFEYRQRKSHSDG